MWPVTGAAARPGDALVLTKPVGTGVLSTALKRDLATEAEIAPAVAAMTTLNAGAARAMALELEGAYLELVPRVAVRPRPTPCRQR